MASINNTYQQLLKDIISRGYVYEDPNRKGVKRTQVSDYRFVHNFEKDGFPIITLREIYYKGAIGEFVSFMNGENNVEDLIKNKVNFWFKDARNYFNKKFKKNLTEQEHKEGVLSGKRAYGDLGKIYPYQMRSWNGNIDQISRLVKTLKTNPMATKKTVTMWNPADMEETSLSACHWSFEALTEVLSIKQRENYLKKTDVLSYDSYIEDTKFKNRSIQLDELGVPKYGLNIKWHQHSVDTYLGLPSNIIYYSLMCVVLAAEANMVPMGIIADLSNVHIYDNAISATYELLKRNPNKQPLPSLRYSGNIDNLTIDCFEVLNYEADPNIKVEMLAYSK